MRGRRAWRWRSRLGSGLCRVSCGLCRIRYRGSYGLCRVSYRGSYGLCRVSYRGSHGFCRGSWLDAGLLSYGSLGFFVVGHYCSFVGFLTVCHR
ncbi:hypothetical protein GCM10027038_49890 [Arthrobacter bambusae]